jgi:hypothetical protein
MQTNLRHYTATHQSRKTRLDQSGEATGNRSLALHYYRTV